MKKIAVILLCLVMSIVHAQETPEPTPFDLVVKALLKANSNFGDGAPYEIGKTDSEKYTIHLKSIVDNPSKKIIGSYVLDLNYFVDVYILPSAEGFTVIVNLNQKVLIKKEITEYRNVFHGEVTSEDLSETANLWFIFKEESEANYLGEALASFKKSLNE